VTAARQPTEPYVRPTRGFVGKIKTFSSCLCDSLLGLQLGEFDGVTLSSCFGDTLLGLQLGGFDGVVMTLAAVTAMVPPLEQLTPKKPGPISTDTSARARLGVMATMQAVTQILYATFAAAQPEWKAGNHTARQVILLM